MQKDTIELALNIAKAVPHERGKKRVACVITTKRGQVVSVGINNYSRSHPRQKALSEKAGLSEERCYIHAELAALQKDKRQKGYKLTVARIDSKGNPQLAMPCVSCMLAIKEAGHIKAVEWT
jgi:deoxycytidylate deaminase